MRAAYESVKWTTEALKSLNYSWKQPQCLHVRGPEISPMMHWDLLVWERNLLP